MALRNLDKDSRLGKAFSCQVRQDNWSRVFHMSVGALYASAIVDISHTRNSVVHGSTWVVSGGHSGGGKIAQIQGHHYSQIKVGIEADGSNHWYFCIYDNAYSDGSSDYATYAVTVFPLAGALDATYETYTASVNGMRAEVQSASGHFTSVGSTSDLRLKSNLASIDGALSKLLALNGYTFDMNGNRETGLVAQEVLTVMPELVTGLPDSSMPEEDRQFMMENETYVLGLKYANMAGLFVEAFKEQQATINDLSARLAALENPTVS
jgi:hypothetical protein